MKTVASKTRRATRPQRRASRPSATGRTPEPIGAEGAEAPGRRMHGDSYSDIVSREDELVGESSSHSPQVNRCPEEPSESAIGAVERLEGSL